MYAMVAVEERINEWRTCRMWEVFCQLYMEAVSFDVTLISVGRIYHSRQNRLRAGERLAALS
jgi:hypothetical protein